MQSAAESKFVDKYEQVLHQWMYTDDICGKVNMCAVALL